jgi:hypothetical protein
MTEGCHDRPGLNPCDLPDLEPKRPDNRPALATIRYRIAKLREINARMLHALPREQVVDRGTGLVTQPLRALTARTTDDPSIALMDAFASALDVLTFYQERIANEGYVRTATERLSAVELLRAIDYELRPGVAASARLAFTVESADDPFRVVTVPEGTQVLSVPSNPAEVPQTFETVEAIAARAEWNAIPARTERPQSLALFWSTTNESDARNGELYLLDLDNSFDLGTADPADVVTIDPLNAAEYLPLSSNLDLASTLAGLAADAALNPEIDPTIKGLRVDRAEIRGIGLAIAPGTRVLAVGVHRAPDGSIDRVRVKPLRIDAVIDQRDYGLTTLHLGEIDAAPRVPRPLGFTLRAPLLPIGIALAQPVALSASSASSVIGGQAWSSNTLSAFMQTQAWSRTQVMSLFRAPAEVSAPSVGEASPGFYLLRQSVGVFGAGAPKHAAMATPDETRGGSAGDPFASDWDDVQSGGPASVWSDSQGNENVDAHVYLEREVPDVVADGYCLLETTTGVTRAFRVARCATEARADFALSGKSTGLVLREPDGSELDVWNGNALNASFAPFNFRNTAVKVGSQPLALGGLPITEALASGGGELTLDGLYLDLAPGLSVSISGERDDAPGIVEDETCTLADVVHVGGFTRLTFVDGVAFSYRRPSLRVNGNVALATHGETKLEALGSGDATVPNQAFKLTKPPLTFIAAATDSGAATTLEVRVDGVAWAEVASLFDAGPNDEVYIVRIDDDGTTRVVFGDGVRGRRLPTGALNVVATYRTGMGTLGQVGDRTLTLLKTRPLGVRAVTNPSAAMGAAGAETLSEARERGPQSVRTLGRIVSLTDYEDYARAFAGIGKAKATALFRGSKRLVHVTVAPLVPGVFDADDATLDGLLQAMDARRDLAIAVIVAPHAARYFKVTARVFYDPRYLPLDVEAAVRAAIEARFGYAARELAAPVSAAELIAVMQAVAVVSHVDLDALAIYSEADPDAPATLAAVLPAQLAHLSTSAQSLDVEPAELLTVFAQSVELTLEAADA